MKFCKDCKYYEMGTTFRGCYHPTNMTQPDMVDGSVYPLETVAYMRETTCGEDAVLFEPRHTAKSRTITFFKALFGRW